jgi:hypothetical protein
MGSPESQFFGSKPGSLSPEEQAGKNLRAMDTEGRKRAATRPPEEKFFGDGTFNPSRKNMTPEERMAATDATNEAARLAREAAEGMEQDQDASQAA